MDQRLALIRLIAVAYLERLYNLDISGTILREVLAIIVPTSMTALTNGDRDALSALHKIATHYTHDYSAIPEDRALAVQEVRTACGSDQYLIDSFTDIIDSHVDDANPKPLYEELVREMTGTLHNMVSMERIKAQAKAFYSDVMYNTTTREQFSAAIEKHKQTIERIAFGVNGTGVRSRAMERISINDDAASATQAFETFMAKEKKEDWLKSGWQGLNDALGGRYFRRGEVMVHYAQPNMYKTGVSLSLLRQFTQHNQPKVQEGKKPLLVRIVLENNIANDFVSLYRWFYENHHQVPLELNTITPETAARAIQGKFRQNGWYVDILKYQASSFSMTDLENLVLEYEAEGFEVVGLNLDALYMMNREGMERTTAGSDLLMMYRRFRELCERHYIFGWTPHQLDTTSKTLRRDAPDESMLVTELGKGGYSNECKRIEQEVDIELFHHIVSSGGRYFLTFYKGKDRYGPPIAPEKRYWLYEMHLVGTIADDVNGPSQSLRKITAQRNRHGSEEEDF